MKFLIPSITEPTLKAAKLWWMDCRKSPANYLIYSHFHPPTFFSSSKSSSYFIFTAIMAKVIAREVITSGKKSSEDQSKPESVKFTLQIKTVFRKTEDSAVNSMNKKQNVSLYVYARDLDCKCPKIKVKKWVIWGLLFLWTWLNCSIFFWNLSQILSHSRQRWRRSLKQPRHRRQFDCNWMAWRMVPSPTEISTAIVWLSVC